MAASFPIDLATNVQWMKATYASAVGKDQVPYKNVDHLVFPQALHDAAAGKGSCQFVNPIGTKEGYPAIKFSTQEMATLSDAVKFTLIGKFQYGHPKMELVRKFFEELNILGQWKLGLMDGRHLLIRLSQAEDYASLLGKQSLTIAGTIMKIIKWTPDFDPNKEPPIIPLWYKFPNLPIQLYHTNALFNISQALGTPLKVDPPTHDMARPAAARVLVERDITLPDLEKIWITTTDDGEGFWQEVVLEFKPFFCQHCRMFGHLQETCYRLKPPLKKRQTVNKDASNLGRDVPPVSLLVSHAAEVPLSLRETISQQKVVSDEEPHITENVDHTHLPAPGLLVDDRDAFPSQVQPDDQITEPAIQNVETLQQALESDWQVQKVKRKKTHLNEIQKLNISPSSKSGNPHGRGSPPTSSRGRTRSRSHPPHPPPPPPPHIQL